jgi:predicted acylesterase/phospholipase RssA
VDSILQARAINPQGVVDATGAVSVLALSGGGANGAFGAGLLRGWSESGTRPVFKLVTGIGAGALIAPFAFLGSGYDTTLEEFYTTITTKDIYYASTVHVIRWFLLRRSGGAGGGTAGREAICRHVDR